PVEEINRHAGARLTDRADQRLLEDRLLVGVHGEAQLVRLGSCGDVERTRRAYRDDLYRDRLGLATLGVFARVIGMDRRERVSAGTPRVRRVGERLVEAHAWRSRAKVATPRQVRGREVTENGVLEGKAVLRHQRVERRVVDLVVGDEGCARPLKQAAP